MSGARPLRVLVADGATVTGGAIVERLAADGARVVFSGRQNGSAAGVPAAGFIERPARGAAGAAGLVREARRVLGGLDGLVVACGDPPPGRLSETHDAAWDAVLATHVVDPWRLMSAAAPALRESGGAIVAIASAAEDWPSALSGAHSVGAHALVSMTRMLAAELAASGVRVNALCPDYDTAGIPLQGSAGFPAGVAAAVAFLLSPDAEGCTAGSLVVDGGRRASLVAGAAVAT